jgi:hypothetical protein
VADIRQARAGKAAVPRAGKGDGIGVSRESEDEFVVFAVGKRGAEVGPDITANGRASFDQLLSNLFEDRKDALMARAREVGYARTLGGVNYPSDVRAAEQLGAALARQIVASEAWSACKAELQLELAGLVQRRERSPGIRDTSNP